MKILYGVQGTGNGHITRARALSRYFSQFEIEVEYLFSGRHESQYFDMEAFGKTVQYRRGLTFFHQAGDIRLLQTIRKNSLIEFWRDVKSLDLTGIDAVITDFEPVTAWAAHLRGIPTIGIGHQYAFQHSVPRAGDSYVAKRIMRYFTPTDHSLGLHWHHFNSEILPPIAEVTDNPSLMDERKILVYFGFEDREDIIEFLAPINSHIFVIYGSFERFHSFGNIQLKPLSRSGFCNDLATCNGVISNAGFELASEAIQLGKKLLVKPLGGQMEQLSNAKALEQLGLGMSMAHLDRHTLEHWLKHFSGSQIIYPNVAKEIVRWLSEGDWGNIAPLVRQLWQHTQVQTHSPSVPSQTVARSCL